MGYRDAAVDSITIRHHVKVSSPSPPVKTDESAIDSTSYPVKVSNPIKPHGYLPTLFTTPPSPHRPHHTAPTTPPSPPPKADKSAVDLTTTRHTVTASNPAIDAFSFMLNDTELKFSATQARADESAPVAAPTQRRHMQLKPAALKLFGGLGAEVIGRVC
ncbi:hypothetical protein LTR97_004554 [Elasticomyces elasticus]|uniref:Uncharacterized protein n=1 Tax=Elasticomyces elasticus TaxID=574655 RepID=A0AAN7W6U9_9PEZI|nr:hypothetical protein LTR97_004554 [Elasticomyces elasticus]